MPPRSGRLMCRQARLLHWPSILIQLVLLVVRASQISWKATAAEG
jgi:hypothetical protein